MGEENFDIVDYCLELGLRNVWLLGLLGELVSFLKLYVILFNCLLCIVLVGIYVYWW